MAVHASEMASEGSADELQEVVAGPVPVRWVHGSGDLDERPDLVEDGQQGQVGLDGLQLGDEACQAPRLGTFLAEGRLLEEVLGRLLGEHRHRQVERRHLSLRTRGGGRLILCNGIQAGCPLLVKAGA